MQAFDISKGKIVTVGKVKPPRKPAEYRPTKRILNIMYALRDTQVFAKSWISKRGKRVWSLEGLVPGAHPLDDSRTGNAIFDRGFLTPAFTMTHDGGLGYPGPSNTHIVHYTLSDAGREFMKTAKVRN